MFAHLHVHEPNTDSAILTTVVFNIGEHPRRLELKLCKWTKTQLCVIRTKYIEGWGRGSAPGRGNLKLVERHAPCIGSIVLSALGNVGDRGGRKARVDESGADLFRLPWEGRSISEISLSYRR